MTNIRFLLSSSLVIAGSFACSASPEEPHASTEQRLEITPPLEVLACSHAICATGIGLLAACDPCATQLCAQDPYCCSTAWDATCVGEVASICGKSCTAQPPGGDAGASTCGHPVCATGAALDATCESCATQLCAQDPYCCSTTWDATCVSEVASICGKSCN
jgi:hypothetical protein